MSNPIEALISFVLNHIYLVFILGGIIWSILAKMMKPSGLNPDQRPTRPPSGMPDFGGGGKPQRPGRPMQRPPGPLQRQPGHPGSGPDLPPAGPIRPSSAGPLGRTADSPAGNSALGGSEGVSGGEGTSGGEGASAERADLRTQAPAASHRAQLPARGVASHVGDQPHVVPSGGRASFESLHPDTRDRRPRLQVPEPTGQEEAVRASDLTGEDMRKAVLWAEILGPPRSRKPYRR